MRELGKFLAAMACVMALVSLALAAGQPAERYQTPIDASFADKAPGATLAAAPATAAQQPRVIVPPADPVGRAKFPQDDTVDIDGLAYVNKVINHLIQYQDDQSHYGFKDRAVAMPDDMKGDCEDYAMTKVAMLVQSGADVVDLVRLRYVWLATAKGETGHAILEVRLPKSGAIAILDNNFDELMTRPELEAKGYRFVDWPADRREKP